MLEFATRRARSENGLNTVSVPKHRSEADLRELGAVLDLTRDAIFVLDMNGVVKYCNSGAEQLYGWTKDETVGRVLNDLLKTDLPAPFGQIESDLMHAGRWQGELVQSKKDSARVLVSSRWSLHLDERGMPVAILQANTDIAARKRAEEAVRQDERKAVQRSEKQLRDVIETIPSIAWTSRLDGSNEFVNPRWQEYTGLSLQESAGFGWQSAVHPDDIDCYVAKLHASLANGDEYDDEFRLRRKDGEYRWFLVRGVPLRDDQGSILKWYGTLTDIEDRKLAEQRLRNENVVLREEVDKASMFEEIVGTSRALHVALLSVSKVAPTDSTVLITGETGTGKELIARAIHRKSPRSTQAFVSANCAAIPASLIASELFGHEKGAFTGAFRRRLGRFELAEGGTIFLDEVGELQTETQIALLRILQEREFERVGGDQTIRADVRVIAATNRDLQTAVATGAFRKDLFYRLSVFPINLPPVRERKEDIPVLVDYFIDHYARKAGKGIPRIEKKTLDLLRSYSWPGNIRELQNVIERAVIVSEAETLLVDESWLSSSPTQPSPAVGSLTKRILAEQRELIETALEKTAGRVSGPTGAATLLDLPTSTLESKIRRLSINKHRFKKTAAESRSPLP